MTLDRKLAAALQRYEVGDFGARVGILRRQVMEKSHALLSGRQIVWLIYQLFRTDGSSGAATSFVELTSIQWRGDSLNQITEFRNAWQTACDGLKSDVTTDQRVGALLTQMRKSRVLYEDVRRYIKKYGHETPRPLHKLMRIVDRFLLEKREEANRDELIRSRSATPTAPVQPSVRAENCRSWMNGACPRGKSCPYLHEPAVKGAARSVAPATKAAQQVPPAASQAAKPASKAAQAPPPGKQMPAPPPKKSHPPPPSGATRVATPDAPAPVPEEEKKPKMLCANFNYNKCRYGDKCIFRHEKTDDPTELKKLADIRENAASRSPSASRRKPPCFNWQKRGFCAHGESCTYMHDPAQKGPRPKEKSAAPSAKP